jgi:hypothetical protein
MGFPQRGEVVVGREPVGSGIGLPELVDVEHVEADKPHSQIRWKRNRIRWRP